MGPEKIIEYQFMENYQIKYEARHGPVPAYQFRENISLHSISLKRVYCSWYSPLKITKDGKARNVDVSSNVDQESQLISGP